MVGRMSPLVRQIDFALEWMLVDAGKALYRYERENNNLNFIFFVYLIDKIINHKMFILFLMVVFEVFY
jgi:hypothetical protein